jgi:hypothetical protein
MNKKLFFIFFILYASLAYAKSDDFSVGFTLEYSSDLRGDYGYSIKIGEVLILADDLMLAKQEKKRCTELKKKIRELNKNSLNTLKKTEKQIQFLKIKYGI